METVKKPDPETLKKWVTLRKRKRVNKKDVLYILVYTLIVVGLVHNIESMINHPLKQIAKKIISPEVSASSFVPSPTPQIIVKYVDSFDNRGSRLETYLDSKSSPLAPFASYIVKVSDEHAIDWTLLVSIAGKESSYGKNIREGSFNPFGLGGSDLMYFSSFTEAIDYEVNLLSSSYREKMISGMQETYCPSSECAPNWTQSILSFAREILNTKAN